VTRRSCPFDLDDRVGLQLRDHMIAMFQAGLDQLLGPIPVIGQEVEFAGDRELESLNHLLSQGDFGVKPAAAFGLLGMVQSGPEGHQEVLPKQSRQNPLMAKHAGHVAGVVFKPSTSRNFLSRLFLDGIVQKKKKRGPGLDAKLLEEPLGGQVHDLINLPMVLPQKAGKAGKGFGQKDGTDRLDHGGGVRLFAQLNKADDVGGKNFEGRP